MQNFGSGADKIALSMQRYPRGIALTDGRLVVKHKNIALGIHRQALVAAQIRHFQNQPIITEFDGVHDSPPYLLSMVKTRIESG